MSSNSDLRRILRRLKREQRQTPLLYRDRAALPFIGRLASMPKLLLDTTVYIDQLQGRLPPLVELSLRAANLWHSTVTECELSALVGLLHPDHPETASTIDRMAATIEHRPAHRIVNPDRDVWRDAGILAGTLARLQHYGKAEQRRVLNDALILLSAAKLGLTVLTRNIADFDLLLQLTPEAGVIFYDRAA